VSLHLRMVKEALGARSVACVVGGSLGGMQALEWAVLGGAAFVRSAVVIACGARHTAWQIGISETQRQAIYADPNWRGGAFDPARPPAQGLAVARQIAMFSYRTPQGFDSKFGREVHEGDGRFQVRRYLEYQGQKFLTRFDALTYVRLTEKMDTHDVGRGRGGVEAALRAVEQPVLVLGIDSDVLYPLAEQEALASALPKGELRVVRSREGHDGFLLEQQQVGGAIAEFLARNRL
jgi:homoserine O-acetyltransferase/O-succinyltransferase